MKKPSGLTCQKVVTQYKRAPEHPFLFFLSLERIRMIYVYPRCDHKGKRKNSFYLPVTPQ